ncbi:hypothetical protein TKK_0001339 [Trichogramma kaykai]
MAALKLMFVRGLLVCLIVAAPFARAEDDYCTSNRFQNAFSGLGFTKEVVSSEYANIASFKALHCCLRGYHSIEW